MSIGKRVDEARSVARSSRLWPVAASASLAFVVVAVPRAAGVRLEYLDATSFINLTMVILISGAAFALDDPAFSATAALPISPARVAILRMVFCLLVITPIWLCQLWIGPQLVVKGTEYDVWGMFIQPFALLLWMWALAFWRTGRAPDGAGGMAAGPALVLVTLGFALLPERWALFLSPGTPFYADSRCRWLMILLVGALALGIALKQGRRYRLGRTRGHARPIH